jgi:hypothetical protein
MPVRVPSAVLEIPSTARLATLVRPATNMPPRTPLLDGYVRYRTARPYIGTGTAAVAPERHFSGGSRVPQYIHADYWSALPRKAR